MSNTSAQVWMKPDEVSGGYHGERHQRIESCSFPPACVPVVETLDAGKDALYASLTRDPAPEPTEEELKQWPREDALREAISLTCGDRNAQYGPPTQDFDRTAALLNAAGYRLNGEDLRGSDVALIMSLLKISRLIWARGKRDSWVDLAGYAGCGFECAQAEGAEDA